MRRAVAHQDEPFGIDTQVRSATGQVADRIRYFLHLLFDRDCWIEGVIDAGECIAFRKEVCHFSGTDGVEVRSRSPTAAMDEDEKWSSGLIGFPEA